MNWYKLNDVCDVRDGTHDSPKYIQKGYPLVTSKNIVDGKIDISNVNYISEEDYIKINQRSKVDNGDILMPMIGTIGKPIVVKKEFDFAIKNVALIKISDDSKVLSKYVKYVLESSLFKRYIDKENRGGTQKFLSLGNIRNFKIPVPTIELQNKIIQILDKARSLIEKRQSQIAALDELIQSVFLEMFGDPYLNTFRWPVVSVSDVTTCIVPSRDKPKSFTGNIPWITISDLNKLDYTHSSREGIGLTQEEINLVKSKVIPKGSVLMSCVGDLGITSINQKEVVINQQLHSYQCSEKINNYFLMNVIPYMKNYLMKVASSTTILYMNKEKCNSIPVILPPIELQREFEKKAMKINETKKSYELSLRNLKGLYNSLLQKAFKGELFEA